MREKKCTKCQQIKPIDDFCHKADRKDGRNSQCRACESRRRTLAPKTKKVKKEGEKVCYTCKEMRPFSQYARNMSRPDMMSYECKICEKERRMERKAKEIDYSSFYLPI